VDPAEVMNVACYDIQRWNRYSFARNNAISYFEANGLLALRISHKIVEAEAGVFLGYDDEGNPKKMMPYAFTTILKGDIYVSTTSTGGLTIAVTFTTFILPRNSGWWNTYETFICGYDYENVLRHERVHVIDVIQYAKRRLEKLEAEYISGRISEKELSDKVKNIFDRVMKFSNILRDSWVMQWHQIYINQMEHVFPEYGRDLFLQWLLGSHIAYLASFVY
jgi:hypothetical protein